jgi:hypothetical protein
MRKATTVRNRRASKKKLPSGKKRPRLHGLLPVPPEVAEIVARETARLPMTKEARQRLENDLTLQYHCGDEWVICRETTQGIEVLAAGWDEVRRFLRKTPLSEGTDLRMTLPDPWE